jgi:PKD repeat protein
MRLFGLLATLALTVASLVAAPVNAAQTTVTFTDFSDKSSLQLNGDTALQNPAGQAFLRLTSGLGKSGSAFLKQAINLADGASFSTRFAFQITAPVGCTDTDGVQGADGITFVVQTVSNTAGGAGGGIGYAELPDSVAAEFDTWNNGSVDDNNGNHVGIDLEGSIDSVGAVTPVSPPFNDGNVWNAWVDYDGTTDLLEVRVSQGADRPLAATTFTTVDLPTILGNPTDGPKSTAFVGFTSGTGCAGGNHDILSWTFINDFNPVGLNAPPDANAGPDQTVTQSGATTSVTLDGTGSTDPDGDALTFAWAGPFVGGAATGANPAVTFTTAGTHTVTLTVNDGNGGTDTDQVAVTVQPPAQSASPSAASASTASPSTSASPRSGVLGSTSSPSTAGLPNTASDGATLASPTALTAVALVILAAANLLALARLHPRGARARR